MKGLTATTFPLSAHDAGALISAICQTGLLGPMTTASLASIARIASPVATGAFCAGGPRSLLRRPVLHPALEVHVAPAYRDIGRHLRVGHWRTVEKTSKLAQRAAVASVTIL